MQPYRARSDAQEVVGQPGFEVRANDKWWHIYYFISFIMLENFLGLECVLKLLVYFHLVAYPFPLVQLIAC